MAPTLTHSKVGPRTPSSPRDRSDLKAHPPVHFRLSPLVGSCHLGTILPQIFLVTPASDWGEGPHLLG